MSIEPKISFCQRSNLVMDIIESTTITFFPHCTMFPRLQPANAYCRFFWPEGCRLRWLLLSKSNSTTPGLRASTRTALNQSAIHCRIVSMLKQHSTAGPSIRAAPTYVHTRLSLFGMFGLILQGSKTLPWYDDRSTRGEAEAACFFCPTSVMSPSAAGKRIINVIVSPG